jgi:NAD(P)-dependent dehydrogenase (short-subunit alcohol dehydrogenase family)
MTNTDEARRAVKETIEQLGGIDIVLSNAVSAIEMPSLVCELANPLGMD